MTLAIDGRRASVARTQDAQAPALRRFALRGLNLLLKPQFVALAGAALLWEAAVRLFQLPVWYLPAPSHIASTLSKNIQYILPNAGVTAAETLIGLAIGIAIG